MVPLNQAAVVLGDLGRREDAEMSSAPQLWVQVVDDEIIVTLPGSRYSVTYYKPDSSPQLLANPRIGNMPPIASARTVA
jgi:hypothetical protein